MGYQAYIGRGHTAPLVGYFVSPTGSSGNPGTEASPWSLAHAFSGAGGVIQPGDTVWSRGGTYSGVSTHNLTVAGTAGARVVFRAYPGELPNVKAQLQLFSTNGCSYVRLQGLDVQNHTIDVGTEVEGIRIQAPGVQLVHCTSRNWSGAGIAPQNPNIDDFLMYGCMSWHNGYVGGGTGRSYGVYPQGAGTGPYQFKHNALFDNFGWCAHDRASANAKHHDWLANVFFNGGDVHPSGPQGEFIFEVNSGVTEDIKFRQNLGWSVGDRFHVSDRWNCLASSGDLLYEDNYLKGASQFFRWPTITKQRNVHSLCGELQFESPNAGADPLPAYTIDDNDHFDLPTFQIKENGAGFVGHTFAQWQARGFDAVGSSVAADDPGDTKIVVLPSEWESGRALVVIYNWTSQSSVSVNLSSVLAVNDVYDVMYAQDFYGTKLISGATYGGGSVSFSMTPPTLSAPPVDSGFNARAGGDPLVPPTSIKFGCFIVRKVGA